MPKNLLLAALSAQICSLSEKSAAFCFETMTGAIHAAAPGAPPAAAAATLSVRETAIASKPGKAVSERLAEKFEVRFA